MKRVLAISSFVALFFVAIVIFTFAIFQWKGIERVFESDSLDFLYDGILRHTGSKSLRHLITFRRPKLEEKLPLDSLILVDEFSELTLRLELVQGNRGLTPPLVLSELKRIFRFSDRHIKVVSDKYYYIEIPAGTIYVLRDVSTNGFLDVASVYVDGYAGNVYIATDTELIARIDPGGYVFGGLAHKVEFKDTDLGLVLAAEMLPINGRKGYKILHVKENSVADEAGLLPDDIIVSINKEAFSGNDDFFQLLEEGRKRKDMTLAVSRHSQILDFKILLQD